MQRFDFTEKMADLAGDFLGVLGLVAHQLTHDAKHTLALAMGADTDLKAPSAEPCLIERPAVADFADHLRFMHPAIFEHQFARLGAADRRNAARDPVARRSGVDEKTGYTFAPRGSRQSRKELHEVGDIGEGRKHLRAINDKIIAIGCRRRLHHRWIRPRSRLAEAEGRGFLAANTWPKIFIDLFAFAVIKDVRDMIAELEGNGTFFQLFGNRDQSNVADFQTAIFFWHIEVPQPFGCSLFFKFFHHRDITLDLRILARFHPTSPTAAFKNIRRVGEFGLQRNELRDDKLMHGFTEPFFFSGQTKIHSQQFFNSASEAKRLSGSPISTTDYAHLSHLAPATKEQTLTDHASLC